MDETSFQRGDKLPHSPTGIHHRSEHPDHIEDPRDSSLIERVDVESVADQISDDVGLEILEGQDEVRLQCGDLVLFGAA